MLELSDEEAHKSGSGSSNVECVEVNNGIKMANKRSKSLEKEEGRKKTVDTMAHRRKRPDTAPPLLPLPRVNVTNKEIVVEKISDDYRDDNGGEELKTENDTHISSWHEHIYRKPPKIPTPYSIMDILQWGTQQPPRVDIKTSDNNNNSSRSYQHVEPSTLQHLLNLNINSPPNGNDNLHSRHHHHHHHANNSSSNGISSRGLSFSETSDEDESVASDQPLNLCVIKSRDSSPDRSAKSMCGKSKKDPPSKSILKRKRSIEVTSDSYLSNDSMSYKETNGKEIDDDEHSINEDGYDEQSADGKRKKKARTTFTGRQIFELEKQFEVKKYLSSSERSEMARLLNVTETQVKIWFQNRKTKWKKQENITNAEASEHKTNGSKTQDIHSEVLSTTKSSSKSVAAELSAKITAKQNSRLKQQNPSNGTKINKHMEPPKLKSTTHALSHKSEGIANFHHHDLPPTTPSFLDKSSMLKSSFHNFHDIESHLSSSKISISDFKPKSTIAAAVAPVALNLKRNYL